MLHFTDGVLKVGDLLILLQLFLDDFLFLLEDAVVEDPHVFELVLLFAEHALVLLLHLSYSDELDLQLRVLLLRHLQQLLHALSLSHPSLPLLLNFSDLQLLLVGALLLKHQQGVHIQEFNLELVGFLFHHLDIVVLVLNLLLVLLPLFLKLVHLLLVLLA